MNIADPKQMDTYRIHLKSKIETCLGLTDNYISRIGDSYSDTIGNLLEVKRQFGKVEAYMDVLRSLFTDDYDRLINDIRFRRVHERVKRVDEIIKEYS